MHMKTIVVPFDFSPNARTALSSALQLAKATASPVLVVHIVHESPYKLAAASNEAEMNRLIRKGEMEQTTALQHEITEIQQLLSLKFHQGQVNAKAVYHPLIVEKIIALAAEEDAGMIVMGTHGATGLKKVLFGSNTAHMISRSPIPVLAIPVDYAWKTVEKIVYASDLEHLEAELKQVIPFAIGFYDQVCCGNAFHFILFTLYFIAHIKPLIFNVTNGSDDRFRSAQNTRTNQTR